MTKEKRILSYAIGYLLVGLFICLIGISNVFASTYNMNYEYKQQYFNNNGSSVSQVTTTWNESLQSYVSGNIPTTVNSYGAGVSISTPIPLIQNHTYTLSLYFLDKSNIAVSSKSNIALSTSLNGAGTNYANSNFGTQMIQSVVKNGSILQFVFKATRNADFLFIPWTTTSTLTQDYVFTEINMEDLGSEGISQEDINNSLNQQTSTITENITNMGEDIKDSIKDTFEKCRDSVNIAYDVRYNPTGNDWWSIVNVIQTDIKQGETYTISIYINSNTQTIAYWNDADGVFPSAKEFTVKPGLNRYSYTFVAKKNATSINQTLTKYGNGDGVVLTGSKLQIQTGSVMTEYEEPNKEICSNKIDETNDKLDETNQNLGDIKDSLTDSSPTDMSGLGDSAGWLPAGPVDSILTLPLTMLNSLVSNLSNNSCQTISVELPFVEENITLPCVRSLYDKMGVTGTLFTTAGLIASAFILFNYLLALYKWVDDTLTMRENTMPGYFDDNWGGGA